jgi:hypothetical protein
MTFVPRALLVHVAIGCMTAGSSLAGETICTTKDVPMDGRRLKVSILKALSGSTFLLEVDDSGGNGQRISAFQVELERADVPAGCRVQVSNKGHGDEGKFQIEIALGSATASPGEVEATVSGVVHGSQVQPREGDLTCKRIDPDLLEAAGKICSSSAASRPAVSPATHRNGCSPPLRGLESIDDTIDAVLTSGKALRLAI